METKHIEMVIVGEKWEVIVMSHLQELDVEQEWSNYNNSDYYSFITRTYSPFTTFWTDISLYNLNTNENKTATLYFDTLLAVSYIYKSFSVVLLFQKKKKRDDTHSLCGRLLSMYLYLNYDIFF